MAKAQMSSFGFNPNSLSGTFSFTQMGNFENLEFCCEGQESPVNYVKCFNITLQTTSFDKLLNNLDNLDFGYFYNCFIRTSGVSGNESSIPRSNNTGLIFVVPLP